MGGRLHLLRQGSKRLHMSVKQRTIQREAGLSVFARETGAHVHVAAPYHALDGGPHSPFKWIQLGAEMEMYIQAAMIDALYGDGQLAMIGLTQQTRKTGHTPDGRRHGLAGSRNCISCKR